MLPALLLRRLVRPGLLLLAWFAVLAAGAFIGQRVVTAFLAPALPGPEAVVARLRELQELATARVVVRTVQRGAAREDGLILSNTDEILARVLVTGDYGFDLATLTAERIRLGRGRVTVRLPAPKLLAPGWTVSPAELLDTRSTRWISDAGPGQLTALQAARTHALTEAPQRIAELAIDREVRDTTRRAISRLLPTLLGDPTLAVSVEYEDEPTPTPKTPQGAG